MLSLNKQKSAGALAAVTAKRDGIERLIEHVDNFVQVQNRHRNIPGPANKSSKFATQVDDAGIN